MTRDVAIPDIGDAEDVEVIEICVAPGDAVAENDALIVIESDKASMEVPAPFAGVVGEVLVALGEHVNTGDVILRIEAADAEHAAADGAAPSAEAAPASADPAIESGAPPSTVAEGPLEPTAPAVHQAPTTPSPESAPRVYAGPAVRRLARELGVDLAAVTGSGDHGRIVKDDVKAFVKQSLATPPTAAGLVPMPQVDFSRFGAIDVAPLSRVRARGAANLHRSWQHVVHVTQHEDVDVTDLEAFRASLGDEARARGIKLTPLPFIVKACIHALKAHPQFNASLDAAVTSLILKRYYHIGIAVDTDDGLVVPVVRDADALGVFDLAAEIERLSTAAREKKLKPNDLQGGSFTVSSLGAIGGTGFTPIVNAPEVAILGVARLDTRPLWNGTEFHPRKVLPLSLSYDHRAINGAEAGRFVADLARVIADIRRLAL